MTVRTKTIRLDQETWDAIAAYRFSMRFTTEAAAIRRLVHDGLAVHGSLNEAEAMAVDFQVTDFASEINRREDTSS